MSSAARAAAEYRSGLVRAALMMSGRNSGYQRSDSAAAMRMAGVPEVSSGARVARLASLPRSLRRVHAAGHLLRSSVFRRMPSMRSRWARSEAAPTVAMRGRPPTRWLARGLAFDPGENGGGDAGGRASVPRRAGSAGPVRASVSRASAATRTACSAPTGANCRTSTAAEAADGGVGAGHQPQGRFADGHIQPPGVGECAKRIRSPDRGPRGGGRAANRKGVGAPLGRGLEVHLAEGFGEVQGGIAAPCSGRSADSQAGEEFAIPFGRGHGHGSIDPGGPGGAVGPDVAAAEAGERGVRRGG